MLNINSEILTILTGSTGLTQIFGTDIYECLIPENVSSPVLFFNHTSLTPVYSKSELLEFNSTLDIICYCDNNQQRNEAAEIIFELFDRKKYQIQDVFIRSGLIEQIQFFNNEDDTIFISAITIALVHG